MQSYKVRGDDLHVDFQVKIPAATLAEMERTGTVESRLKLSTTVNKVIIATHARKYILALHARTRTSLY